MTIYVKPIQPRNLILRRWGSHLASEKDSGVKHTHLGPVGASYSFQKGPTDYLFTVSIVLQGVPDGARYRITDTADDSEIATGVQSGTGDITITGVGYAGSVRTLQLKVRKASSAPYYKPYDVNFSMGATGASVPISMILDT